MPRSIVSTTSAWCSASRAAQLMASDGVASADGSRCCGRSSRPSAGAFSQRRSCFARNPVKPRNSAAITMLKPRWNRTTCWCRPQSFSSIDCAGPSSGIAMATPTTLKTRLPIGSRRSGTGLRAVTARRGPRCRRWRPAPGPAPSASARARMRPMPRSAARSQDSSTTAPQCRPDDDLEHHLVRQRGQQCPHRRRLEQRLRALHDEPQRHQDQPETDRHPAQSAGGGLLARDHVDHAARRSAAATATTGRTRTRPPSGCCRRPRPVSPPAPRTA